MWRRNRVPHASTGSQTKPSKSNAFKTLAHSPQPTTGQSTATNHGQGVRRRTRSEKQRRVLTWCVSRQDEQSAVPRDQTQATKNSAEEHSNSPATTTTAEHRPTHTAYCELCNHHTSSKQPNKLRHNIHKATTQIVTPHTQQPHVAAPKPKAPTYW